MTDVISNIKDAKAESRRLTALPTPVKDSALSAMADALDVSRSIILEANARDVENARSEGLGKVMLKRLLVDDSKIDSMIAGIRSVISLKDPVGDTLSTMDRIISQNFS